MRLVPLILALLATACGRLADVGQTPDFSPIDEGFEASALASLPPAQPIPIRVYADPEPLAGASLWTQGRASLLGDRRAEAQGDILTVVVEIDEKAEIDNSTNRARSGSESLSVPDFLGLPQRINERLPEGASLDTAVSAQSQSASSGNGAVRRKEKLTLRIAATVTGVQPNGILRIEGRQEVRVNFELREMLVTGYVRPEDITRQNEITYDKIASARISYGGRGQISDVQQPRYGQQIADIILPF
ncbi:MAG: flagellar basal body L-ring protein FlgH [Pseudomonadota bacterium]